MLNEKVWIVIPAAGVGSRMQADRPKQYLPLLGKTVIEHTLACFLPHPQIAGVVVVVSQSDAYWPTLAVQRAEKVYTAIGGKERADSVLNGLDYLVEQLHVPVNSWVLVHDAARPCLPTTDLDKLLQQVGNEQGAILATPVRDTMKRAVIDTTKIAYTEDRKDLWHALTPQLACLATLRSALHKALVEGATITDEASALEWLGLQPTLVEGDSCNIKITRPSDLAVAKFFLQ